MLELYLGADPPGNRCRACASNISSRSLPPPDRFAGRVSRARFAQYRYHDALFPSLLFRQTYDALCRSHPQRADQHYLRLLHLAANSSETEVEIALALLLEAGTVPTHEVVRSLVRPCERPAIPEVTSGVVDLSLYDQLLVERRSDEPVY